MRKSEDSHKGAEECGAEGLMGFLSTPYQVMTPTSKDGEKWLKEENTMLGVVGTESTKALNKWIIKSISYITCNLWFH